MLKSIPEIDHSQAWIWYQKYSPKKQTHITRFPCGSTQIQIYLDKNNVTHKQNQSCCVTYSKTIVCWATNKNVLKATSISNIKHKNQTQQQAHALNSTLDFWGFSSHHVSSGGRWPRSVLNKQTRPSIIRRPLSVERVGTNFEQQKKQHRARRIDPYRS